MQSRYRPTDRTHASFILVIDRSEKVLTAPHLLLSISVCVAVGAIAYLYGVIPAAPVPATLVLLRESLLSECPTARIPTS